MNFLGHLFLACRSASNRQAQRFVESVESSRCVAISGISTCTYEGFSTPMGLALFIRHIHSMRSVGGRNSAGSGASECIAFGLLPGLYGRLFRPQPEFGEKDFISQLSQDLCPEDWATPEAKVFGHPLYCSFNFQVESLSILYPLLVWRLSPTLYVSVVVWTPVDLFLRSICEKETAVQYRRKVLPLTFRRLYHKQTFSL